MMTVFAAAHGGAASSNTLQESRLPSLLDIWFAGSHPARGAEFGATHTGIAQDHHSWIEGWRN
jgi:hypothetical protein